MAASIPQSSFSPGLLEMTVAQMGTFLNTYEKQGAGKHEWKELTNASLQSGHIESLELAEKISRLYNEQIAPGTATCIPSSDAPGRFVLRIEAAKIKEKQNHEFSKVPALFAAATDNLNAKDAKGKTALIRAAGYGHTDAARFLLARGASLTEKDNKWGLTALLWACNKGHLSTVQLLIDMGAHLHDTDDEGATALHLAASFGFSKIVKLLLDKNPALAVARDNYGRTPLHDAAQKGHHQVVRQLLEINRALADVKSNTGNTALHLAAQHGRTEVVRQLLELNQALADVKNDHGNTALHWAATYGNTEVVRKLLEVNRALADVKNNKGITALHYAVEHSHQEVVTLLLERAPALLDITDNQGKTALLWAAKYNTPQYKAIRDFLLERGADSTVIDSEGGSLFFYACKFSDIACLEKLVQAGNVTLKMLVDKRSGHSAIEYIFEKGIEVEGLFPLITALFVSVPALLEEFFVKNADGNVFGEIVQNSPLKTKNPRAFQELFGALFKKVPKFLEAQPTPESLIQEGVNPLVLPLLFFSTNYLYIIRRHLGEERFHVALTEFKTEHPKAPIDELVFRTSYRLNPSHLSKTVPVPPKPAGVEVRDLLKLFDTISFPASQRKALRKDLEKFISTFENGTILGVRKGSEGERLLERLLTATVASLQGRPGTEALQEKKREMILNFLKDAKMCGPKITVVALDLYKRALFGLSPEFDQELYDLLGTKRTAILQSLVPPGDQNTHDYTRAVKFCGLILGIPGAEALTTAGDAFEHSGSGINIPAVVKQFWSCYNVWEILQDILSELTTSQTMKDKFLRYLERQAPRELLPPYTLWFRELISCRYSVEALEKALSQEKFAGINCTVQRMFNQALAEHLQIVCPERAEVLQAEVRKLQESNAPYTAWEGYLKTQGVDIPVASAINAVFPTTLRSELMRIQAEEFVQKKAFGDIGDIMNPKYVLQQATVEEALLHCGVLTKSFG